ncbi:hypothetical protein I4U23_016390 [Adineta vaga]|nr:hypothetical protein I4U23_016390 [Adineta vaga]
MGALRDWNRSLQYVNLIKQSRIWGSPSTPWDGNATFNPITGWPTNDFGVVIATNNLDMGGKYFFYAKGNANISTIDSLSIYITDQTYDKSTNTLTACINVPQGQPGIILSFRNTTGPGLQDMVFLQSNYNLTSKFNVTNLMLTHLSRFNLIRFMAWTDTNNNPEMHWNETTSLSWPQYTPPKHNPWQTIPLIINQFNKSIDIWINIPFNASDNYILNIAQLMSNELNNKTIIYVEYSNELWNRGFSQAKDNLYAANDSVRNHGDPLHLNYDNIKDIHTWAFRRTAYQIKRISDLFKMIFGNENVGSWKRIRPILAGQTDKPHVIMTGLDYLNDQYGAPSTFLHGIAIAPYMTLGKYRTWSNLTTDQVLDVLNSSIQRFLPEQGWSQQAPLGVHGIYAAWYKLAVYAYEGGPDTSSGCQDCSLEAKINATRHPRMIDLCKIYLNGWYRFGFEIFNWYVAGAGNIELSGTWNLLEDMRQETLIDTTKMFNSSSPVAQLPRPSPKLNAIDQIRQSSIKTNFGISLPSVNFNATNFMNHQIPYPDPDLRNLNLNMTFYYPLQILQPFIHLNLTVYVAGNSGILEASINNAQFIQIQTPKTANMTIFQAAPLIQFNINQTILSSIVTLRLKIVENGYSIRSFDVL